MKTTRKIHFLGFWTLVALLLAIASSAGTLEDDLAKSSGRDAKSINAILSKALSELSRQGFSISREELSLTGSDFYWAPEAKPVAGKDLKHPELKKISQAGYLQLVTALSLENDKQAAAFVAQILARDSDLYLPAQRPAAVGKSPLMIVPWPGKKPAGVAFAWTDSGRELPVVDVVSHPQLFAPAEKPGSVANGLKTIEFIKMWKDPNFPSGVKQKITRGSLLIRYMFAGGSFYGGEQTYIAKIGPTLGHELGLVFEKSIRAKFSTEISWRMRSSAKLLGEGIVRAVRGQPSARTVRIIDIAGGTAITDLNAIMYARQMDPHVFDGKDRIVISLFDVDEWAANFAKRAITALSQPGQPLAGLRVEVDFHRYNWEKPQSLEEFLRKPGVAGDAMAGISEGGLFEYGENSPSCVRDDGPQRCLFVEDTMAVLQRATPPSFTMTGTAYWTRDRVNPVTRVYLEMINSEMGWKFRFPSVMQSIGKNTGWEIEKADMRIDTDPPFLMKKTGGGR